MEDVKKYLPFGALLISAIIVTGIAGWLYSTHHYLGNLDSWGIPFWLTPLGYLGIVTLLRGAKTINKWHIVLLGILAYAISAVLLFVPELPPGLAWHYPMGAAAILFFLTTI